ncbi:MAG: N-acetylmuramoyl-L-alanine amidase [Brotaphodocola sp.]
METRNEVVYAAGSSLNVRNAPGMDAEIVGILHVGDELMRVGYSTEWSRVIYKGQERYVASRYLTTTQTTAKQNTAAQTADDSNASVSNSENKQTVSLNANWKYANFAKITSGNAVLYHSEAAERKGKTVCVNAGHGTRGGESVKTQCHPDGTAKVTSGTTSAGAVSAVAVSGGMTFADGTPEAKVTLALAKVLKDKLLARGYDVLMIRESDDVQLDNIARTVIANQMADCHIALHWDSTTKDKGAFYMSVPDVASYRSMEPVASNWQKHHALGDSLIAGLRNAGVKIFSNGTMAMDLTQTSYSTIPSVDIELGDKTSDHGAAALTKLADGLTDGVEQFFSKQ